MESAIEDLAHNSKALETCFSAPCKLSIGRVHLSTGKSLCGGARRWKPARHPGRRYSARDAATIVARDQFSQYSQRDEGALQEQLEELNSATAFERFSVVFTKTESCATFESAARRHFAELRGTGTPGRVLLCRSMADPTFGRARGRAPNPPRFVVFESLESESTDGLAETSTTGWLRAIDRTGATAMLLRNHHSVVYSRCTNVPALDFASSITTAPGTARYASLESRPENESDAALSHEKGSLIVASEVLNADWSRGSATQEMREKLMEHSAKVLASGRAMCYDVLQSVNSVTCFKTLEIYPNMDALQDHMNDLDPAFAEDMASCRAAVNRVRQVFSVLHAL